MQQKPHHTLSGNTDVLKLRTDTVFPQQIPLTHNGSPAFPGSLPTMLPPDCIGRFRCAQVSEREPAEKIAFAGRVGLSHRPPEFQNAP